MRLEFACRSAMLMLFVLTLQVRAEADPPVFYLSPGSDPTGDLQWQAAVGGVLTEFDFDSYGSGFRVDSLVSGDVIIDVGLDGINGLSDSVSVFWGGYGSDPSTVSGGALLSLSSTGSWGSQMTLEFSEPVTGAGLWVFDDGVSYSESSRMIVVDGEGQVWTSDVLEAGNGNSWAVEGFIGVVSSVGISKISIENVWEGTVNPFAYAFEVDHLQVGDVLPSDSTPPVAVAGPDQPIHWGDTVHLNGTGSYDDTSLAENLQFAWVLSEVPDGSTAALVGFNTAMPWFTADVPGAYRVELTVIDEAGLVSDPDDVMISSLNLAPTAAAGEDRVEVVGSFVQLDGVASSDPDGDELLFYWSLLEAPSGSIALLVNDGTPIPFFIPDLPGDYVIELVVDDRFAMSVADAITITAITGADFAQNRLLQAAQYVGEMDENHFDAPGHKNYFCNMFGKIVGFLQKDDVPQAISHLQSVMTRTDGCYLRGIVDPKGRNTDFTADFIVDHTDQLYVYGLLSEALWMLDQ